MSYEETGKSVTVCRVELSEGRGDPDHVLEPGVYLFLFPGCEDGDPEAVVSVLVTKPNTQRNLGLALDVRSAEIASEMGLYLRIFDDFPDMADTVVQGLMAVNGDGLN